MPILIRFMIHHLSVGFVIGAAAAALLLVIQPERIGESPLLTLWLYVFSFGAPLALGSLALALLAEDDRLR